MIGGHSQLGAGLLLHAHVRGRVHARTHQHGCQTWLGFPRRDPHRDFLFDPIADFLCDGSSINDLSRHLFRSFVKSV
jgi:hypothetical protein